MSFYEHIMINFKRKTEEAPTEGISVHKIYLKKIPKKHITRHGK